MPVALRVFGPATTEESMKKKEEFSMENVVSVNVKSPVRFDLLFSTSALFYNLPLPNLWHIAVSQVLNF